MDLNILHSTIGAISYQIHVHVSILSMLSSLRVSSFFLKFLGDIGRSRKTNSTSPYATL